MENVYNISNMYDQQEEQAQYYDKLLLHMNRTFAMNMKSIQLFLDLTKQTKTIRFKSIKNIYNTLTQGKADEVIYKKDKGQLITNHVYNAKFTQRTCWRIIEKLITKVAFYLSHQRLLSAFAPSIIKVITFLRNANDKINNRISFVQFFEQVIDTVINENNALEQKIYDLLIKRGYIYSIDEFYRLNRFQGSQPDYICPNDQPNESKEEEEKYSLQVNGTSIDTYSISQSKRSKSKFGLSSKKFTMQNRTKSIVQAQDIAQQSEVNAQISDTQSEIQQQEQEQLKVEQVNRLSYEVHQQIQKTVDLLLNNHDFQSYVSSKHSQEHVSSLHDSHTQTNKPSMVKQLLKNLKNRNFKANQKILVINSSQIQKGKEQQRKNSSQSMLKNKKRRKQFSTQQKNRTSIAMALSKGMKQKIFKNEHLADIEDLIINNLDRMESKADNVDDQINNKNKNILFRNKPRQHTQMLPIHNQDSTKSNRRASNFQFLNKAFNLNQGKINNNKIIPNQVRRISNFAPQCHMSQVSSHFTIQTVQIQDKNELKQRYVENTKRKKKINSKGSHKSGVSQGISRFAQERQSLPKQNRFFNNLYNHNRLKTDQFNATLLTITAQKYNKCVTEQAQNINHLSLKQLSSIKELNSLKSPTLLTFKQPQITQNTKNTFTKYQHYRKYDIYDTKMKRIL